MAEFTAKDVQNLRQITGAGMMDAKKALTENDGDFEAAKQWLREKGLAKVAKLGDRENSQGSVCVVVDGSVRGKLSQLAAATTLEFLRSPPGNHLEALSGDRVGQHSVRINKQWRVCFVWTAEGPADVEIVDYH